MASAVLADVSTGDIVASISSAAMIFGGVVPYIPQYLDIRSSENSEGFSLYVCLALLVANALRILFWFGHPFELPLLVQSIVMTIAMLTMIHLCVRVKQKTTIVKEKERTFSDFDSKYFWAWSDFQSYVECLLMFTLVGGALTYVFLENLWFIETMGFLAVFCEAMLGAPQFYRNAVSQSTAGMSQRMVLLWLCGDLFKTGYFIVREAPTQFWVCGTLQVIIDISIMTQVFLYRNTSNPKHKF